VEAEPEQLLAEARGGRRESLGALLERYRSYLYQLARAEIGRRLQARANSSDLVQETFLQASRHFGQFGGGTEREWRGWLRSILRRRLLRLVRRQVLASKRSVRCEVPLDADGSTVAALASPDSSPSAAARRRERDDDLTRRLARLPAAHREVLVLRHLEGLPFPEVARRMGRSPGAVRVLWLRALERLRRRRRDEGEKGDSPPKERGQSPFSPDEEQI
jgi:RNA polymerase sigma-70 factor, ECF subfamily